MLSGCVVCLLVVPAIPLEGAPLVGIVQLTRKLDVNLRLLVYLSLFQETVDELAKAEKGSHGHRVANAVGAWRSELIYSVLTRAHTRVSL